MNFYRTDGRFVSSHFSYDNTQDTSNKFTNLIQPAKPYDNIVYCEKHRQYIGWSKGEIEINVSEQIRSIDQEAVEKSLLSFGKVFTKDFDLLSTSKSLEPLECLAYEKNTGDVITCAANGDIVVRCLALVNHGGINSTLFYDFLEDLELPLQSKIPGPKDNPPGLLGNKVHSQFDDCRAGRNNKFHDPLLYRDHS